jgi:poly-beta-1,6-N-acetyl-D-glucosamine synthase
MQRPTGRITLVDTLRRPRTPARTLERTSPNVEPLAEALRRARAQANGRFVVAVIPAHNEERQIGEAIRSLSAQDTPPQLVLVCADGCTDETPYEAAAAGAYVLSTSGNKHKKAGALNHALKQLLPELRGEDGVLVMDADSFLAPTFLTEALNHLRPGVGGVGGVFAGRAGGGFVGMLQRNEFARHARDVARLKGKVLVLTGTATVFSAATLRHVERARAQGILPGGDGGVYDTAVLTEDNELTLALLHLGYAVIAPRGCRLTTEVMETWRELYRQRLRWKRGSLENLRAYGLTRITAHYWGRQLMTLAGIVVTILYLASLAWGVVVEGSLHLHPLWLAVTAIFVIERVVTVRSRGFMQMAIAAPLVVEMTFDGFLQIVHAKAILDTLTNRERKW